jgi:hypothetical protein
MQDMHTADAGAREERLLVGWIDSLNMSEILGRCLKYVMLC